YCGPARRYPGRGSVTFDHGWSDDLLAACQGLRRVACAVNPGFAVEDAGSFGLVRSYSLAVQFGCHPDRQCGAHAQGHDLDWPVERRAMHEGAMMRIGEQLGEVSGIERCKPVGRNL